MKSCSVEEVAFRTQCQPRMTLHILTEAKTFLYEYAFSPSRHKACERLSRLAIERSADTLHAFL